MTDLNLRAARIQLYGLIAAVVLAILIAIGITTGAFVLSFAVLRDLAHQGGMPVDLAWIFPAIVDGAILGATIAAVVLSKINGSAMGKRFFIWLLVSVVCISVAGNAYHAYKAAEEAARNVAAGIDIGTTPLTPTGAALIAIIPPLLVLAFTHGIGILIKAIGTAYAEYNELVNSAIATEDATPEPVALVTASVAPAPTGPAPELFSVAVMTGQAETDELAEAAVHPSVETFDLMPAADDVAHVAQSFAPRDAAIALDVADVPGVVAPLDTGADVVAPQSATIESEGPEQTTDALLAFIDNSDLDQIVKATARMKITQQHLSWAAIAAETGKVAPSTAMRRYRSAEKRALAAGFDMPPLPDLEENQDLDEIRELVNN